VQLRVRKKDGKEAEDVLDPDAGKSVWDKLWSGKPGAGMHSIVCVELRLHMQQHEWAVLSITHDAA
jgi:hypothetical protein